MCKFVYIFRTDENPFGSCQPCSNNIHITYDDNTSAHRATCGFTHCATRVRCASFSDTIYTASFTKATTPFARGAGTLKDSVP